jgi:hypothetical protein
MYKTFLELTTGEEIELHVEYDYQPYEPPTWTYPGAVERVDFYQAHVIYPNGIKAEVCLLNEEEMEEEILNAIIDKDWGI